MHTYVCSFPFQAQLPFSHAVVVAIDEQHAIDQVNDQLKHNGGSDHRASVKDLTLINPNTPNVHFCF